MTSNQIAYWNYIELVRSNRAKEAENYRSNLARETETARSNRENESIAYNRYLEEVRAHQAQESLGWSQLAEAQRRNDALNVLTFNEALLKSHEAANAWEEQLYTIARREQVEAETQWINIKNTAEVVSKYGNTASNLIGSATKLIPMFIQ